MRSFLNKSVMAALLLCFLPLTGSAPYPVDGYETTGIRRLVAVQRIVDGQKSGTKPPPGALKSIQDIALHLDSQERHLSVLPAADPALTKAINAIFPGLDANYSVSVLDITEGRPVRYAERRAEVGYQPGSVGKIAVLAGVMSELEALYPFSFERRQALMRDRKVLAGKWAMSDHHTVPIYDPETDTMVKRTVRETDVFSLYEWVDHMMSVSNNGAASVVWREAVLMRVFGQEYPALTQESADAYFRSTPKAELSRIANDVVNAPLRKIGISSDEWRLGSFFTQGAGSFIPGIGGSIGTTRGLIKFLMRLETGSVIDQESSLEMKRMMYMTDRRIRYAASPRLSNAAVYFKSGSLYSCKAEEGFKCVKYAGNVRNFMNSVAIVEHPDGSTYMVVLMSNVLKKNSASDHMELAASIDRIVRTG